MRVVRGAAAVMLVLLAFTSCGGGQKTGSDEVLDFEEQQKADQLGAATPTPKPKAGGATSAPTRTAAPAATAKPAVQTFDVQLIAGNPYFAPSDELRVPAGTTLRVTNSDTTPERSNGRSFTAENGAFDSGLIKPGGAWSHVIAQKGTYTIVDKAVNFARATLTVY
jgi:plastocyanin